jgi:hypothetical protein
MNRYINFGTNIETFILSGVICIGFVGLISFLKIEWKRYGVLFLVSAIVANSLCLLFVQLGFYSFPYRLFPKLSSMPIIEVTILFPLLVFIGVRYSPKIWGWKIPFYWGLVHIGMFFETIILLNTRLIIYEFKWDVWDSYTWWWIYFLVLEWVGSLIIPETLRRPISIQHLNYGKIGWFMLHFILIVTIFLGGYFVGSLKH